MLDLNLSWLSLVWPDTFPSTQWSGVEEKKRKEKRTESKCSQWPTGSCRCKTIKSMMGTTGHPVVSLLHSHSPFRLRCPLPRWRPTCPRQIGTSWRGRAASPGSSPCPPGLQARWPTWCRSSAPGRHGA